MQHICEMRWEDDEHVYLECVLCGWYKLFDWKTTSISDLAEESLAHMNEVKSKGA